MTCQLRVFDEHRDLQSVVNLYNTAFAPLRPYYSWPVTVERFRDKVLSHWEFRKEGLWCASEGDELVGFVLSSFRNQPLTDNDQVTGDWGPVFISAIAVAAGRRRRGLGRALVGKAVQFARDNGRRKVAVSANPRAPMPFFIGVQEDWHEAHRFLTGVGFDFTGMMQNMARGIAGFQVAEPVRRRIAALAAEGYQCRLYDPQTDYQPLTALLAEHGWPYWDLDMLSKVGKWTKTRPFMETCFLECGTDEIYGPDEVGVVVKDGRMLSFCAQTLNPRKAVASLGPMLTARDSRGLGLGTIALQISLEVAARKGMTACDLWTGLGGHITHYYGKSGFQPVLKWFDYAMTLPEAR